LGYLISYIKNDFNYKLRKRKKLSINEYPVKFLMIWILHWRFVYIPPTARTCAYEKGKAPLFGRCVRASDSSRVKAKVKVPATAASQWTCVRVKVDGKTLTTTTMATRSK